jgi:hypothetical protein
MGASGGRRSKVSRKSRPAQNEKSQPPQSSQAKFNLTGTSEFTDSGDKIISDIVELQRMQNFITQKASQILCVAQKCPK